MTSILINKPLGWHINSVLLWWHGFRRCPVCPLPESNCPRFVLLCQDALTSARHNCAQLPWKVAAMWHDLKGIWGQEMCKEKMQFPTTGAPLVHIYSYVCHENRHATFILCKPYQLDCKRIEYCISNYVAVEQYVFYSATTDKMATLRHSSLMLLDSSFELRLISSCYAVRTSCFHESQGFGLQLRPLFTIVISHYSFDGI